MHAIKVVMYVYMRFGTSEYELQKSTKVPSNGQLAVPMRTIKRQLVAFNFSILFLRFEFEGYCCGGRALSFRCRGRGLRVQGREEFHFR